jgi:hypothetical protein
MKNFMLSPRAKTNVGRRPYAISLSTMPPLLALVFSTGGQRLALQSVAWLTMG